MNVTTPSSIFKVIYLGNQRVGKTSLNRKYLGQGFSEEYLSTMGIDITKYHYEKGDKDNIIVFWDVGWQEKFAVVRQSVYLGTNGVILVFDLSQKFEPEKNLEIWIKEFAQTKRNQIIPLVILGNKLDLNDQRQVSPEQGQSSLKIAYRHLSSETPVAYFETSAKTGEGVLQAFNWLIEAIIELGL